MGNYSVTVQDYQYKSRPPVVVRVSGLIDGECKNGFGEPCYFYKSTEVMTMKEGVQVAEQIIDEQMRNRPVRSTDTLRTATEPKQEG